MKDDMQAHAGAIVNGVTPPKVAAAAAQAALEQMNPKDRKKFLESIPEYTQAGELVNQLGLNTAQLLAGFSFVKNNLLPKDIGLEDLRDFQEEAERKANSAVSSAETRLRNAQVNALGAAVFGTLLDDPDDALVKLYEADQEKKRKEEEAARKKAKKAEASAPAEEETDEDKE